jgi:hypothetical protein
MAKKTKAEAMMITRKGIKKSLREWAELSEKHNNIPAYTIEYRVLTLKWDIEKALTTPKKQINYNPIRNPRLKETKIKTAMQERTVFKHKGKVVRQSKFKMIDWQGQTKSLYDWAVELTPQLGISITTLERRVLWRNWDIDKAFTTPSQKLY